MFEGFTQETSDFLWELSFNNERPWFLAHKEQFERCLNTPFKALGQETWRLMSEKCPEREFYLHISRIYRDARRLFGRGPYKDHLWFTIFDGEKDLGGPAFFFELGAATYSYGMGFWDASPTVMETFRRTVDANPARFRRIAGAVERRGYSLFGPEYKRPKKKLEDPLLDSWYNRKWVSVEKGFDPNWARDQLMNIMSPYWVYIAKSEASLQAALTQVEYMRDKVIPKLQAASFHDVRMCLEMQHKVLNAELSLRASLAREETRGLHFRTDFPYRDDENFLCFITLTKNAEGGMDIEKVPVKDEWKGDLNADYADRYGYYFPGEREAKGLPEEEESSGGWGKK